MEHLFRVIFFFLDCIYLASTDFGFEILQLTMSSSKRQEQLLVGLVFSAL